MARKRTHVFRPHDWLPALHSLPERGRPSRSATLLPELPAADDRRYVTVYLSDPDELDREIELVLTLDEAELLARRVAERVVDGRRLAARTRYLEGGER